MNDIPWKDPWYSIDDAPKIQSAMNAQLAREMPVGHALEGYRYHAIARRMDNDDVLFVLDDGPEVAVVHLTWRSSRETSPVWPHTARFSTLEAFIVECLEPDAADYNDVT
jgi:hypothetical protein